MEQISNVQDNYEELLTFIDSIEDKRGALIAVLHRAQHIYGYLSDDVIFYIAEKLKVPSSKVFGVISFYSYFTTKKRGKYIVNVCLGTACFVKGADAIMKEFEKGLKIKSGETSEDMKYTLAGLRCIGACGLAPVVMVNDKVYGRVTNKEVAEIIKKMEADDKEGKDE